MTSFSEDDLRHLRRCVTLARTALESGDNPFGSVLVSPSGDVLFEDHNHVRNGDGTQHPELAIARWAAAHLPVEERQACTVYTSGEHCPMCAGAHAWANLGRIVYVVATKRLDALRTSWGVPPGPLAPLPISAVAPHVPVEGPVPELADEVESLYAQAFRP